VNEPEPGLSLWHPARKLALDRAACYPGSMLRVLLKLLLAAAAVAAVWAYVPMGGRTMADRWRKAKTPSQFVDRTWAELRGLPAPKPPPRAAPRAQARTAPAPRPTESHRESDRRELDRIVSEHLQ